MGGRLGCDIDYLKFYKVNLFIRNELTLTKLKPCSLSREIGFPNRATII
jgi:hypothetical protein